jgi:hypothetical protein
MIIKELRKWRFELFQTGQRAAKKLVMDVFRRLSDRSQAVVSWETGLNFAYRSLKSPLK